MVDVAEQEEAAWTNSNGTKKQEGDKDSTGNYVMESRIEDYYGAISNAASGRAPEAARDQEAWSAAFISYVAGNAGITPREGFELSIRHITYMLHALKNRRNGGRSRPFWLYAANEIAPAPGDILCKPWNEYPNCTNLSVQGLDAGFLTQDQSGEYVFSKPPLGLNSHGDLVVARKDIGGTSYIETPGGNTGDLDGLGDTVGRKRWELDANGRVTRRVDANNQQDDDCMPFAYVRIAAPTEEEFRNASMFLQDGVTA